MANQTQLPKPSDLKDWSDFGILMDGDFSYLVHQRIEAKEKKEEMEALEKKLNAEIEGLLTLAEVEKGVKFGQWDVLLCNGASPSKLDSRLLLEKGVAADLIAECTVAGKPYSYIMIKERKVKK